MRGNWLILTTLLMVVAVAVGVGCSSPAEKEAGRRIVNAIFEGQVVAKEIAELQPVLEDFATKGAVVMADLKAGKINRENADALMASFDAGKKAVLEKMVTLKGRQADIKSELEAAQVALKQAEKERIENQQSKWKMWGGIILGAITTALGGAAELKRRAAMAVVGVLSRAGDRPESYGDAVSEELKGSKITEDKMRDIHHKATAGTI